MDWKLAVLKNREWLLANVMALVASHGKSPISIHASGFSSIILLAAFDTGTSSGVVLERKADGVSSLKPAKLQGQRVKTQR